MKRLFFKPLIAVLALSVLTVSALVHFVFAAPFEMATTWLIESALSTEPLAFILMVLTVGVALFNKAKVTAFLERIMTRRIDRYVIHSI